jgi:hypothetical protein
LVVVDAVRDVAANDAAHLLDDPLAAGVGVLTSEHHRGDVLDAQVAALVQHARVNFHPVNAAAGLQERRSGLVPEAA